MVLFLILRKTFYWGVCHMNLRVPMKWYNLSNPILWSSDSNSELFWEWEQCVHIAKVEPLLCSCICYFNVEPLLCSCIRYFKVNHRYADVSGTLRSKYWVTSIASFAFLVTLLFSWKCCIAEWNKIQFYWYLILLSLILYQQW